MDGAAFELFVQKNSRILLLRIPFPFFDLGGTRILFHYQNCVSVRVQLHIFSISFLLLHSSRTIWSSTKTKEKNPKKKYQIIETKETERCATRFVKMQKIHAINSSVVNSNNNNHKSDTSTTSDLIASVVIGHTTNNNNSSKKNLSASSLNSSQNGSNKNIRPNLKSNSKIAAATAPAAPAPAAPNGISVTSVKPKTAAIRTAATTVATAPMSTTITTAATTPAAPTNGTITNNINSASQPNTTTNNHDNSNSKNSSHNNNNNNNILMSADIVNLANVLSAQTASIASDAQAKQVLKEAVDAVVNSFAKHTQGYGRGECTHTHYRNYTIQFA